MFQSIHQSTQSSDNSEDDIKAKKESILDPNAMMHGLNRSMQMGGSNDPANSGDSGIAQAMFHEEDEKPSQMKTIQKAGVEEEEPVQGKNLPLIALKVRPVVLRHKAHYPEMLTQEWKHHSIQTFRM